MLCHSHPLFFYQPLYPSTPTNLAGARQNKMLQYTEFSLESRFQIPESRSSPANNTSLVKNPKNPYLYHDVVPTLANILMMIDVIGSLCSRSGCHCPGFTPFKVHSSSGHAAVKRSPPPPPPPPPPPRHLLSSHLEHPLIIECLSPSIARWTMILHRCS